MLLEVKSRMTGGVAILDLKGRITIGEESDSLRNHMMTAFKSSRYILLNCEELGYADSSGIGEMVYAYSSIVRGGGMVKLLNPHTRLRHVLKITNLDRVFDIVDDERTAVESFTTASTAKGQQKINAFLTDY